MLPRSIDKATAWLATTGTLCALIVAIDGGSWLAVALGVLSMFLAWGHVLRKAQPCT